MEQQRFAEPVWRQFLPPPPPGAGGAAAGQVRGQDRRVFIDGVELDGKELRAGGASRNAAGAARRTQKNRRDRHGVRPHYISLVLQLAVARRGGRKEVLKGSSKGGLDGMDGYFNKHFSIKCALLTTLIFLFFCGGNTAA